MKLFLACTSLRPAYGGPAYSVSRLAVALTQAGVHVGLWAADQSAATTPLLLNESCVQRLTGSVRGALNSYGKFDVLHDNGIWLSHNHRLAQLSAERDIPRVVSTRGMLEPWAMNHKRSKKWIAWWLYQRRDLERACCHHATADTEANNVQRRGLGVPVRVIPNGVDVPCADGKARSMKAWASGKTREKTALFLGRIHPKKGLPMLIEAWTRVRPHGWLLKIAGPDEGGHQAQVEKAIIAGGLSGVVSFAGTFIGETKEAALFEADLLVLPTHSENFGLVIAEALAHGLPVLTTTGAPWPMLKQRGCGWWVEPTVDDIANGLRQATSVDSTSLHAMGAKGRELVAAEFSWPQVAKQFVSLYQELVTSTKMF